MAFGAPKEIVEAIRAQDEPKHFEVYEENWQTVSVFVRLRTQWQANSGAIVGLHYPSIEFLFKILEIKDQKDVFDGLQIMESAALPILNKRD